MRNLFLVGLFSMSAFAQVLTMTYEEQVNHVQSGVYEESDCQGENQYWGDIEGFGGGPHCFIQDVSSIEITRHAREVLSVSIRSVSPNGKECILTEDRNLEENILDMINSEIIITRGRCVVTVNEAIGETVRASASTNGDCSEACHAMGSYIGIDAALESN